MSYFIIRRSLPSITWTPVTYTGAVPRWLAQRRLISDPASGQILTHSSPDLTSGIYSRNMFALNPATLVATNLGGGVNSGSNSSAPDYPNSTPGAWNNGDGATPQPWLSDRHPDFQTCIDTLRNRYVQWSGLAIGNPESGNGTCWNDLWFYALNSNPALNTFSTVATATKPSVAFSGAMVYDQNVDLYILHGPAGFPETWVYAPSNTLSANQITAGCVAAKTWSKAYDATLDVTPPYQQLPMLFYHPGLQQSVYFAWENNGVTSSSTAVWTYTTLTKTWANLSPSNPPSNGVAAGNEWMVAYLSTGASAGKFLYHRTSHTNAVDTSAVGDFLLDPVKQTWTQISASGFGPSRLALMEWHPGQGVVVAHEAGGQFWHGTLS